jgi:hypothetical protein
MTFGTSSALCGTSYGTSHFEIHRDMPRRSTTPGRPPTCRAATKAKQLGFPEHFERNEPMTETMSSETFDGEPYHPIASTPVPRLVWSEVVTPEAIDACWQEFSDATCCLEDVHQYERALECSIGVLQTIADTIPGQTFAGESSRSDYAAYVLRRLARALVPILVEASERETSRRGSL